jgi:hypothetical protein
MALPQLDYYNNWPPAYRGARCPPPALSYVPISWDIAERMKAQIFETERKYITRLNRYKVTRYHGILIQDIPNPKNRKTWNVSAFVRRLNRELNKTFSVLDIISTT